MARLEELPLSAGIRRREAELLAGARDRRSHRGPEQRSSTSRSTSPVTARAVGPRVRGALRRSATDEANAQHRGAVSSVRVERRRFARRALPVAAGSRAMLLEASRSLVPTFRTRRRAFRGTHTVSPRPRTVMPCCSSPRRSSRTRTRRRRRPVPDRRQRRRGSAHRRHRRHVRARRRAGAGARDSAAHSLRRVDRRSCGTAVDRADARHRQSRRPHGAPFGDATAAAASRAAAARVHAGAPHPPPQRTAESNDLRNLVELCWFHHRLVHEGGWNLRFDHRRRACWPSGRTATCCRGRDHRHDRRSRSSADDVPAGRITPTTIMPALVRRPAQPSRRRAMRC